MINEEIQISGKKFISLKRASEISGYAKDYIGQLCRGGKLESKRFGRDWFVSIDDLNMHKQKKTHPKNQIQNQDIVKTIKRKEISPKREIKIRESFSKIRDLPRRISLRGLFAKKTDTWDKELLGNESGLNVNFDFKKLSPAFSFIAIFLLVFGSYFYSDEAKAAYAKWAEPVVQEIVRDSVTNIANIAGAVEAGVNEIEKVAKITEKTISSVAEIELPEIPRIRMPRIALPEIEIPKIELPKIKIPEISLPKIALPDISIPELELPKLKLPKIAFPNIEIPEIKIPKIEFPKITLPKIEFPKIVLPEIPDVRHQVSNIFSGVENTASVFSAFVSNITESIAGSFESAANDVVSLPKNARDLAQDIFQGGEEAPSLPVTRYALQEPQEPEQNELQQLKSELAEIKASGLVIETPIQERTVVEKTVEKLVSGISSEDLEIRLQQINNSILKQISDLKYDLASRTTTPQNATLTSVYQAVALSQNIDTLKNVTITNPTFSGTISGLGGIISDSLASYLPLSGGSLTGDLLTNSPIYASSTLVVDGTTTFNNLTYTWPSSQTANYYLQTNGSGTLSWAAVSSGGTGADVWELIDADTDYIQPTTTVNAYFPAYLGIGTTSPYAALSVAGEGVFDYITATSTTATSTFPYLTSTGLQISSWLDFPANSITDSYISSASSWNNKWDLASTTIAVAYGGTGATSFTNKQLIAYDGSTLISTSTVYTDTGGTGLTSYSIGDLLYASTAKDLAALAITASSSVLVSDGTNPAWNTFLGVVSGGTGATSFTSGSVVFSNGTILTQDNSNFFWDDSNNRLGIGTTSPYAALSVAGEGVFDYITATSTTATSTFPYLTSTGLQISSWLDFPANSITDAMIPDTITASNYVLTADFGTSFYNYFSATTTDYLTEGSTNKYWQDTLSDISLTKGYFIVGNDAGLAQATSSIFVDSTGNIGIGTAAPTLATGFTGEHIHSAGNGSELHITNSITGATASDGLAISNDASNAYIWQYENQPLIFATNSTQQMTILAGGNVGIGDTSPAYLLTVGNGDLFGVNSSGAIAASTGITTTGNLTLSGSSANILLGSNYLSGDGGDEGIYVDSTGNVGIGTSTPYSKLTVWGDGTSGASAFEVVNNASTTLFSILDNGLVGIGTTSPYAPLSVVGEGGVVAETFTATSTTATSTFPYLTSTGLQISSWLDFPANSITDSYISSASSWNNKWDLASTTIGVAYGGTGATSFTNKQLIAYDGSTLISTSTVYTDTGGTGLTSYSIGDLLYASTAKDLAALAITASSSVLVSDGTNPAWNTFLGVVSGGTGATSFTSGSVVFSNGTILTQDNSNFFWDDSNNRLGLGTTTPDTMLHLYGTANALRLSYDNSNYASISAASNGDLTVSGSSATESAVVIGSGAASQDVSVQFDGQTQDYYIGLDNSDSDKFHIGLGSTIGASALLSIPSTGNFGISTTSPYAKLSIEGTTASTDNLFNVDFSSTGTATSTALMISSGGLVGIGTTSPFATLSIDHDTGEIPFAIGSTTATSLIVDAKGNVGIGIASPHWNLQVAGTQPYFALSDTSAGTNAKHWIMSSATGVFSLASTTDDFSSSLSFMSIDTSGTLSLGTGGTNLLDADSSNTITLGSGSEAMRITDNGLVGIGTASPAFTLSVDGTAGFPSISNDSTGYYLCLNTTTGEMATSTGVCVGSSERFKENIEELTYGLNEISQLRPVFYSWKHFYINSDDRQVGLIAEEVAKILPELAGKDEEGNIVNVDYPKLTAVLIRAVQELNEKISSQSSVVSNQIAGGFDGILDWLSDKVVVAKEFIADKITARKAVLDALEMKDSVTGEVYCVRISEGEWAKFKGTCGDPAPEQSAAQGSAPESSEPPAVVSPEPTPEPEPEPEAVQSEPEIIPPAPETEPSGTGESL